jgi:hypothetical protein
VEGSRPLILVIWAPGNEWHVINIVEPSQRDVASDSWGAVGGL